MTAEEIITRRQQGLIRASPIVARIVAEWLSPAVVRVVRWMLRTGRLLPLPPSLSGKRLKFEYSSPMAQSQRASGNQAVTQAFISMAPLINSNPKVLLNVDEDRTFREGWINQGADPRLLRRLGDVRRLRDAIDQQEQTALSAQTAKDFAGAGKDAAQAAAALPGIPG